jgi:hypothetical protein
MRHKKLSYLPRRLGFNSIARTQLRWCIRSRSAIASLKVLGPLEDDHDGQQEATMEATTVAMTPLKVAVLLAEDQGNLQGVIKLQILHGVRLVATTINNSTMPHKRSLLVHQ